MTAALGTLVDWEVSIQLFSTTFPTDLVDGSFSILFSYLLLDCLPFGVGIFVTFKDVEDFIPIRLGLHRI